MLVSLTFVHERNIILNSLMRPNLMLIPNLCSLKCRQIRAMHHKSFSKCTEGDLCLLSPLTILNALTQDHCMLI